ncbi:mitogen-activated protein kinase kinase kinase 7-like [Drosophila albomicans]|uniref:Mitogen-activated protein kinase kinase kinase 7-like n=1 Tax=Drosophila albomicans TaxID=7291 RepID=A0A9C6SVY4_DROAB|nr:mitogen-activated protein kinase kinase kinase 7-like [Drosophila albomicans]
MDSKDITVHHKEVSSLKRIGSGSYGVVYKGIWRTNAIKSVKVAVKCLEKGNNKDSETNILREIRNLQELKHENIVTFHGAYRQKNICLIFEYSDCGSLYDYLQKKIVRVSNIEKLHWMLQCANGMEYLHSKKTIHRDLKPHNLLLFNNYRTLKICDFGTVKQYATENTELIGTIGYMAPEVCTADGKYTEKCDVFSYGITFWEVFAEKKPFDDLQQTNMHPLAIQNKIINVSREKKNCIYLLFECSTVSIHNLFHDQKCTNRDSYLKLEWIYQCLQGLDYLHSNNIVHGDLTTENLLLFDNCRNVKIFVIKKVDELFYNAIVNNKESVYVAPEVHSGEREFTKESDIYSFGIIMWEIVTAKNPVVEFKNKQPSTIMKIINDIIHTRTSDIRKIRNAIEDCLKTAEYRPDTKELIKMLIS